MKFTTLAGGFQPTPLIRCYCTGLVSVSRTGDPPGRAGRWRCSGRDPPPRQKAHPRRHYERRMVRDSCCRRTLRRLLMCAGSAIELALTMPCNPLIGLRDLHHQRRPGAGRAWTALVVGSAAYAARQGICHRSTATASRGAGSVRWRGFRRPATPTSTPSSLGTTVQLTMRHAGQDRRCTRAHTVTIAVP